MFWTPLLVLAYAVAPGPTGTSAITMTVESSSAEGKWSCILDLWISTGVTHDAKRKHVDMVTVTVHAPHARMEAAPGSRETFRDTIAAESPSQQQAIALLDGKSLTFPVDRTTGAVLEAPAPRFPADVSFAGIDAGYWFALLWAVGPAQDVVRAADGSERLTLTRTHATSWGVPWKLKGEATLVPGSYLARSGTLAGGVVVGRAASAIERRVTITLAPRP